MSNNGRVFLGLLGGLAAGVAAGILLAPKPGKDTIEEWNANSKKWTDQINDQWGKWKEKLSSSHRGNPLENLESHREELVGQVEENIDNLPHRIRG